jgi:phosphoglycolate phosphatase-like HAD superfamily hydrolase
MLTLFWDIDGTLLTTAGAGMAAWRDAAADVAGGPVDLSGLVTGGLPDAEIAATIGRRLPGTADDARIARIISSYEGLLPAHLPKSAGRVLDGVREILEDLRGRVGVLSLLLTGNTRAAAAAKLAYYGLDGYFAGGAFSDGAIDRADIARTALALAGRVAPKTFAPDRALVIGDTPHDISCARAIGVRALAVASGAYTVEQLVSHAPWAVVDRLPSPADFAARIGLPMTAIAVP